MITLPEEKLLYSEIQKKLFYIIPEKWESIYLYASVIDVPKQKPVGEMYFYYLPKGIIKKKYVNGYEIPNLFNIDEEQYSKLITDVYNLIKQLNDHGVDIVEEYSFLRRGDFPKNEFVTEIPDEFYEWALLLKKAQRYKDGKYDKFSE